MTPKQAAILIGCSVRHVRHLIVQGRLAAKRIETPGWGPGFVYEVNPSSARQYRDSEQTRGFPRGQKRS